MIALDTMLNALNDENLIVSFRNGEIYIELRHSAATEPRAHVEAAGDR